MTPFQIAQRRLNAGKTRLALQTHLGNERQSVVTAETRQQCGICYRMLGMVREANEAFSQAMELAGDNAKRQGSILRDWAMVATLTGDFPLAFTQLNDSLGRLRCRGLSGEYFVTMGFIGRIHYLQGNRQHAEQFMHMADVGMRGDPDTPPVYVLNNAAWWLKTIRNPFRRLRIAKRVFPIARQTRNYRRMVQLTLLVTCHPVVNLFS